MPGIITLPAQEQDWRVFLHLAADEGWRIPANEIAFHRRPGADSALALRRGASTVGFVTAVAHGKNGWIGNLLIAPCERGQGFGAQLFDRAALTLQNRGCSALWLTASAQGTPLYRRRGFIRVGDVVRWVRPQGGSGTLVAPVCAHTAGLRADAEIWGEPRELLLHHLGGSGHWLLRRNAAALLQQLDDQQILGPWLTLADSNDNARLLDALLAMAQPGKELVVDALVRDESSTLLRQAGFAPLGSNGLMVRGTHAVNLQGLFALASLGSIG